MRSIVAILAFATSLAAQTGGIDGTVLNSATRQPLAGVHLRFYAAMMIEAATEAYGAVSGPAGHFSIDSIPPGNYTVELERTGFLARTGDGFMQSIAVAIHPGERVKDYSLSMAPLILVSGRAVNRNGEPLPGSTIELSRTGVDTSGVVRASDLTSAGTAIGAYSIAAADDRAQFRLFAPPGKYYLAAWIPRISPSGRSPGGDDMVNMLSNGATITYYPDAADANSATALELKAGAGITGLTVRLRDNTPPTLLTVNGTVSGIPPGAAATVRYQHRVASGSTGSGAAVPVGPGGRFTLRNLAPGTLRLFAEVSSVSAPLQSDVATVNLDASGAPEVHLALTPGGAIRGSIEIAGGGVSAAILGKLSVRLAPTGAGAFFVTPPQMETKVADDGSFAINGLPPNRYSVVLTGMPDDAYIQSVVLNGAAAAERTLDFSGGVRGSPNVKITIGLNGAEISGEVRNADGGALLTPNQVMVSLTPEASQAQRRGAGAGSGHYVIKGIPPGRYKIYAADLFGLPSAQMAAAQARLEAAAESIEVKEGDRLTEDLKAAPKEALRAIPQ